jgi:hypothetical protein
MERHHVYLAYEEVHVNFILIFKILKYNKYFFLNKGYTLLLVFTFREGY